MSLRSNAVRNITALVVVAAALLGLALPAMQAAREAARQQSCLLNLKFIGIGLQNYCDTYRCYPYGTWQNESLPVAKRFSWILAAKPFLEAAPEPLFDLSQPWDASANLSAKQRWKEKEQLGDDDVDWIETPIPDHMGLRCPSKTYVRTHSISPATYPGAAGLGHSGPGLKPTESGAGFWGSERTIIADDVSDGLGNTLLLIETARDNGPWTAGGRPTLRSLILDDTPVIGENAQFGGFHPDRCQAALADASVRSLASSIDRDVLAKLFTICDTQPPTVDTW